MDDLDPIFIQDFIDAVKPYRKYRMKLANLQAVENEISELNKLANQARREAKMQAGAVPKDVQRMQQRIRQVTRELVYLRYEVATGERLLEDKIMAEQNHAHAPGAEPMFRENIVTAVESDLRGSKKTGKTKGKAGGKKKGKKK